MVHIKSLSYVLILVISVACKSSFVPVAPRPTEVTIIYNKNEVYVDTLYITNDKNGPIICGIKPQFFHFYNELQEEISPVNQARIDTLSIRSRANYQIVKYQYNPLETIDFIAFQGDTILIDNSNHAPYISIKNRMAWGINYDWGRDRRFGRIYGYNPEILINNEPILFLKSLREKFDFNKAKKTLIDAMRNNNKVESLWLDSLYRVNLLDSVEYRFYKTRNRYQRLGMELKEMSKPDMRNVLLAYSDSTYRNDFYLFYRNYYDAVVRRYYADKTIRLSNGVDIDHKNTFDRIDKDTLLSGNLREVYLYYCFRKIDELCSITDGKKYYDRVARVLRDTALLSNLHRNYDVIYNKEIIFTDDLLLQNTAGVSMPFQEILSANRGRVIYVDFWASWCAPCMAGMPASKRLREEYRGKDVAFVYLAFNDKAEPWKAAIPKAELADVPTCYLVANPRTSKLIETLKISSIPRYLIYDKQGRLVHKNAPRPESEQIRDELDKYLK